MRGDALNHRDVKAALAGVDAVTVTLGVGLGELFRPVHLFSDAARVLIAAMKGQAVKGLICVTGVGTGDSRASIGCLLRDPFQIAFCHAYDDKSRQERLIKESALEWAITRSEVLTGGRERDATKFFASPKSGGTGSFRARTSLSSSFDS